MKARGVSQGVKGKTQRHFPQINTDGTQINSEKR
jgi:hypothetical protein